MKVRRVDGALSNDRNCLCGAIDACSVESLDVVNCGEVCRRQKVVTRNVRGQMSGSTAARDHSRLSSGLRLEVMQMVHSDRHPRKHSWHGRLRGVGKVHFAIHEVAMNLGAERGLNLRDRPLEEDLIAAVGHSGHRETLRLQPCSDFLDVASTHSETVGELSRRQPLVIVRRRTLLLFLKQFVERSLLGCRRLEHQRHAAHGLGAVHAAKVKVPAGQPVHIALQPDHRARIDRTRDAVRLNGKS